MGDAGGQHAEGGEMFFFPQLHFQTGLFGDVLDHQDPVGNFG